MWYLETWFSGGCGNAGLMVGLNNHKGHFQSKLFCDSTHRHPGVHRMAWTQSKSMHWLKRDIGTQIWAWPAHSVKTEPWLWETLNSGIFMWNLGFLKQNKISESLLGEEVVQNSCCASAHTLLYCKRASLFRQAQRNVDICNVYLIFPSLLFLLFWCSLRLWRFKITFFPPETTSLKTKIKQLEIACCQSD